MRLAEICIERPVFATVLSIALMVFGLIGFKQLETRYFPEVDQKISRVSVYYAGASPSLMATQVTSYLENALINVKGLSELSSTSTYNHSYIYLRFASDTNMIKAMGDVRDEVSGVQDKLPVDADPPGISVGGVARPVLNIGFMDPNLTPAQIRDFVTKTITPPLLNLPGMGAVWAYGAAPYALRIWLDPQKMAAFDITVTDVQNALQSNNIDFSAGSIRGKSRNYSLVSNTRFHTPQEFSNMIIRDQDGQIVHLGDIANVLLGSQDLQDSPMRINGKPAIDLEIRPLDTANPIVVAKEAKAALAQLQAKLPPGMTMMVTYDQSTFLLHAISESFATLIEAIVLVMIVVYLFLGSLRGAFIPIVTIPVCVIGVFGVMLLLGYSINVMTLLAIILAIGLVVDDAIVVLENIHRYLERGETPIVAALKGIKEIGFSVVAMTLTLAAVYAPIGFMSGFTATVFREFAFTLAGAVLISGFVALTLSPMMCSRVLKPLETSSKLELALEKIFHVVGWRYQVFLRRVLTYRWWVIFALLVLGVSGYFVYQLVPQSFIPKEDIGYFTVDIASPPGSAIHYTDQNMAELEKIYQKVPEIQSYASFVFSGSATNFVTMKPWGERHQSTEAVLQNIAPAMYDIPGVNVNISVPDPVDYGDNADGKALQINIMTLGTYQDLQRTMDKLVRIFKRYPGLTSVTSNLKFDNSVYEVNFKRNQAAASGVNLQNVADTVALLLSGKHIGDIQQGDQTYEVLTQMQMQDLSSFSGLGNIYVRGRTTADNGQAVSTMVPLENLITLSQAVRQSSLYRYNRMDSAQLSAQIAPGYSLNKVIAYVQSVLSQNLSSDEQYAFDGRVKAFLSSSGTMLSLFLLSVIFIYLVLAAQFESFVDPFVIMLTVPLCIVGALITLLLTKGSLNLYTNIGLITLVGLITKHGILITQFANARLKSGEPLAQAVTSAAVVRLRPILMTTFAMVLGALPLALSSGPGSISHQQIGWVIVGGMLFGTFFSLVVVPVAYYFLAPLDHKKRKILLERQTAKNCV